MNEFLWMITILLSISWMTRWMSFWDEKMTPINLVADLNGIKKLG
jgi:hypothetical protein